MPSVSLLVDLIQRKFSYLFDEYGFQLVEAREFRPLITYYVIVESNTCRILFVHEANWDILFGEPGRLYEGSLKGWVPVSSLFLFLLGELPPRLTQQTETHFVKDNYHAERLDALADELRLILPRVIDTFKSPEVVLRLRI